MSKLIPISKGHFAIVDDDDYDKLMERKWQAEESNSNVYATRSQRVGNGHKHVRMHRQIMNAPAGMDVDHINHNGLDNRKENLRVCTRKENLQNKRKVMGSSKYKGVNWHKRAKKWAAMITVDGKGVHLGLFISEEEAANTYNSAALLHYGLYASLNKIDQ